MGEQASRRDASGVRIRPTLDIPVHAPTGSKFPARISDPAGITARSRGLSAATPPEQHAWGNTGIPAGCQRRAHSQDCAAPAYSLRYLSASSAAAHPCPAAVIACR